MFDTKIRPLIDPPLNQCAIYLVRRGITANIVTGFGFLLCVPLFTALYTQNYGAALFLMLLNRFMDGIDGPIARHGKRGASDFGGYIDLISDFIFYSGFIFFFAAGAPYFAVSAAFLLFSFFASGVSFLGYAIIAAKRNLVTEHQGTKSFFYMAGIAEGAETITAFLLICIFPAQFTLIAIIFGFMCLATALGRTGQAYKFFKD